MWQMVFAIEWQMPPSHKHDQNSSDTLFNQSVTSELGKWYLLWCFYLLLLTPYLYQTKK
jgi:hypothetical protein